MAEERIEDSEAAYVSPRPEPEVIALPIRRLSTPLESELSLTKIMEEFPGLKDEKTTLGESKVSASVHEPITLEVTPASKSNQFVNAEFESAELNEQEKQFNQQDQCKDIDDVLNV